MNLDKFMTDDRGGHMCKKCYEYDKGMDGVGLVSLVVGAALLTFSFCLPYFMEYFHI